MTLSIINLCVYVSSEMLTCTQFCHFDTNSFLIIIYINNLSIRKNFSVYIYNIQLYSLIPKQN